MLVSLLLLTLLLLDWYCNASFVALTLFERPVFAL